MPNNQGAKLFLIILLEGFVTVSLEILVIRQLIPFVGNNVIVTSLIIGTFLLFMAIGYWYGGRHTANFYQILQRNFYLAAMLTVIGVAYIFLTLFFTAFENLLHLNTITTLVIYLLMIIAPLIYILGQTVPITMNLVKKEQLIGMVGGKVLFLSTVGSFLGAILTSLLLMEFFGVAVTVYFNFCVLLLLVLILSDSKYNLIRNLIFLPALLLVGYSLNIAIQNQIFIAANNYANYSIETNVYLAKTGQTGKVFKINNSFSSFLDEENQAFPYIEKIKTILFHDLKLQNKNILIVGAGGFSLSAGTLPQQNNFTYVDIDPSIAKIATSGFIKKINGTFVGEDARIFLKNNKQLYDVVLSDAYSNSATIPAELLTVEYFRQIRNTLTHNGLAIFNIIADPLLRGAYAKRVDATIRAVFPNCTTNPSDYASQQVNLIYVCQKSPTEHDNTIYTDNLNSATLDNFRKN